MVDEELHDRTHVIGRDDDRCLEERLLYVLDVLWLGKVLRARDLDHLAIRLIDVVIHRGTRRNEVEVEFTFQTLLDDLHVQEAQEPHAKAKA